MILIETQGVYHYYTEANWNINFLTSLKKVALEDYHKDLIKEKEEKKLPEIEMMEGVNEEDDLDEDDENVEAKDVRH